MSAAEGIPSMFAVVMPDDAMGERTPKGVGLVFRRTDGRVTPADGEGVVVQDGAGGMHIRMAKQGLPGQPWIAAARNEAYESFEMGRDNFRLIGLLAYRQCSTV